MLVLSRQRHEVITIDFSEMSSEQLLALATHPPIKITVVDIRGDKVRLGFDAPKPVSVHRLEVYEAVRRDYLEFLHGRKEQ